MPSLTGRFIRLCERNPDGSYATRANRLRTLVAAGRALHELEYKLTHPQGLKPKHIEALVTRWQQEEQTSGTLKNKLSVLRWWAEKVDTLCHRQRQYPLRYRQPSLCDEREQGYTGYATRTIPGSH